MARSLDWHGLMRAGLHGLGLSPEAFWKLTPFELSLMLGVGAGEASAPMSRSRLDELMARWPDPNEEIKNVER